MKQIVFSNYQRAKEIAESMNINHILLENCETRGSSYHKWIFSENSVVVAYAHGEGKYNGRFAVLRLICGKAWKVGRDETNLNFYNESVVAIKKVGK